MKKQSKVRVLLSLVGLVKPLKWYMCFAVLAGSLSSLTVQFIPVLGAAVIASGLGYSVQIPVSTIWWLLPVLALARAVLRYCEQRTNHYIAFTLLAIIRDRVFKAMRRLCPAKLEGRDKGDLISLITSDVELLEVFYAHTISPICIAVLVETVMCLYIGHFHPALGIAAMACYLWMELFLPAMVSKLSGNMGEAVRKKAGALSAYVLENIRGIDAILQFDAGKNRLEGMQTETDELTEKQGKLSDLTGTNAALSGMAILLSDLLILLLGAFLYQQGKIAFDDLLLSVVAFMSSFGPVAALSSLGTTLQGTIASGERILSILHEVPETEEIEGKPEVRFEGAGLEDVTFGYGESKVLTDVTIGFPKDRIVGIVGPSGCGKSTMLRLLMRFWQVHQGQVTVSCRNVEEINTRNLRDMESFMTQETVLFQDSIANNVRIARLDATDEQVIEACRKAALHDFIMSLPEGYETPVGELGDTLSGGERQRIGLARAFLHDADFLLLDEPTSNLDSLNEAMILRALREEAGKKTVVLVSHRASTMRIADSVYTVSGGRIQENNKGEVQ